MLHTTTTVAAMMQAASKAFSRCESRIEPLSFSRPKKIYVIP